MIVKLNPAEINVIKLWAESNIHGGHWGDSDVMVPEENIILQKLDSINHGEVNITPNEARIILMWSESALGIHTMEESQVIEKLNRILRNNDE